MLMGSLRLRAIVPSSPLQTLLYFPFFSDLNVTEQIAAQRTKEKRRERERELRKHKERKRQRERTVRFWEGKKVRSNFLGLEAIREILVGNAKKKINNKKIIILL
jgi:hypothetical protein